ncbi:MAG TPA: hypothetical protein DCS66_19530 [Flavobacteriaceae bacterium]|nr:hypothetical protein [Flavobacteriaceae bacterium]
MAFITNITTTPVANTYLNGLPSGVDNRQGNIRGGGNIADTTEWTASTFGEGNPVITIVSGAGPVEAANTAGAATFNQGTQVVNAIQTTIAGIANTALLGAQSDSANVAYTPLQLDVLRTYYYKTAVRAGNWNVFTGAFSSISNTTVSGVWNISASIENTSTMRASGTDIAANPTQDIPGRLTYRDGSPNPIQSGYGPRYNW